MDRKKIVLGLFHKQSIRQISKDAECGLATVGRTKIFLEDRGISLEQAIEMDSSELESLFEQPHRKPQAFAEEDFADVLKVTSKIKMPMSLKQCWEQYCSRYGLDNTMGYKTYCKRFQEYKSSVGQSMRDEIAGRHLWSAGYAAMIDYSGDGIKAIIDGKEKMLQIFVAVLPYSSYSFAWATADQTRLSWFNSIRAFISFLGSAPKYLILDNSTTCITKASKVIPKYAPEFKQVCSYYGIMPYAAEPHVPLAKPHAERAVKMVQNYILSVMSTERPPTSLREANQRISQLVEQLNRRALSVDPSESRESVFEAEEKSFLQPIPAIPWGSDVVVKRLKVQKEGLVRYQQRRYRVNYRYCGKIVNVVVLEDEKIIRFYSDKHWELIGELPLRDGKKMIIDDLREQSPGSQFMQKSASELLQKISSEGPYSHAVSKQLGSMDDELQAARFARFLVKIHSKIGAEAFEKVLEQTPRAMGQWDLILLEVSMRRRACLVAEEIKQHSGKKVEVLQDKEPRNLRGAEHYKGLILERKKDE